jgi:hypothetical protein
VHSLPTAALALHQFAPVQSGPVEPHLQVPAFWRSPAVFPQTSESVQRALSPADKLHIWFGVQTGAVGSVAELPHVKRDALIWIPSPCAAVASAGLKHLTLSSFEDGRVSQCWFAAHSVPPQLHLKSPFCVDPSWFVQSCRKPHFAPAANELLQKFAPLQSSPSQSQSPLFSVWPSVCPQ